MNRLITFLSILAISFGISCPGCADRLETQLEHAKENLRRCEKRTEENLNELEACRERVQETRVEWFRTVVSRIEDAIRLYESLCVRQECSLEHKLEICTQLYSTHRLIKRTKRIGKKIVDREDVPLFCDVWLYFEKRLNELELKVKKYLHHVKQCNW